MEAAWNDTCIPKPTALTVIPSTINNANIGSQVWTPNNWSPAFNSKRKWTKPTSFCSARTLVVWLLILVIWWLSTKSLRQEIAHSHLCMYTRSLLIRLTMSVCSDSSLQLFSNQDRYVSCKNYAYDSVPDVCYTDSQCSYEGTQ